MANLFRMSTGGGGQVVIDDVLTPGTTGYTGTIQVGDLEDADTLVIDATENPTVASGVRSWELTTGSDFDKVTHFGTKIEAPSTVVNVALDDGVASHTHAAATDVAQGKYFWNASGEYVEGSAAAPKIDTAPILILRPTLITRYGAETFQTVELSEAVNQDSHAFYVICVTYNDFVSNPRLTKSSTRGHAVVLKDQITYTSGNDFLYSLRTSDGATSDGTVNWKYVDNTHLAFANTYKNDLYFSVYAYKFV